ncbi:T9SS type A sorting domain-containing protein [Balneola sp. EhC07]|uniref:T9SS type A sorting domain-containing protein n=1 Tax=Balneola sp. EhC07 TaxID=1849360 RepID=UPI001290698C|nr:T9SS type A sorting domain-containing protein [Balneola sp. EhC07]
MKFLTNVLLVMLLASPLMGQTVTQLEYFFDSDPGFGNGISISVTEVDGEVTYEGSIMTSSLSRGLHTLFIRAKNSDDEWGLTIKKLILVDQGEAREIETLEYFFDEDPGHGSGTAISISASAQIDKEAMLSTEGLSVGLHTVFIRAKFTDGNWGMPIKKLILIDQSDPDLVSNIISAEYFFNTDPGFAAATPISVNAAADIETTFTIPSTNLPIGDQILFVRVMNADSVWGMYSSEVFSLSEVASLTFESSDTLEYFQDSPELLIAGDIGISSSTDISADSAIIKISNGFLEEDSLFIDDPGSLDIDSVESGIKISGNASLEDYQDAIRTAYYINNSEVSEKADTLKEFSITVYSGAFASESVVKYVEILDHIMTSNEGELGLPKEFSLRQNYPNPFNPSTNIEFALPEQAVVSLKVYNLLGREISTLVSGRMSAGIHKIEFNASGLSTGLYFYRIQAGGFMQTKKMMLIK